MFIKALAVAGLQPDCHLTLREIVEYGKVRQDYAWWHTAALCSAVANLFSSEPISPAMFHPMHMGESTPTPSDMAPVYKDRGKPSKPGQWKGTIKQFHSAYKAGMRK